MLNILIKSFTFHACWWKCILRRITSGKQLAIFYHLNHYATIRRSVGGTYGGTQSGPNAISCDFMHWMEMTCKSYCHIIFWIENSSFTFNYPQFWHMQFKVTRCLCCKIRSPLHVSLNRFLRDSLVLGLLRETCKGGAGSDFCMILQHNMISV